MGKKNDNLVKFGYNLHFKNNNAQLEMRLVPTPIEGKKAVKEYKKLTAKIDVNGNEFQADIQSINYMTSVLSIANFRFNQAIAAGLSPEDAYKKVYSETISWKTADNKFVDIPLGLIADALEKAMLNIKNIITKY